MTAPAPSAQKNPSAIRQITVKKLFGYLDYNIPGRSDPSTSSDRLIILYGDNGSGKTTLLQLIFSLLSPSGGGRKGFIAKTPFQSFQVTLNNGYMIAAYKSKDALTGRYTHLIRTPLGAERQFAINTNEEGKVTADLSALDKELGQLPVHFYFLPDDRRVQTMPHAPDDERAQFSRLVLASDFDHLGRRRPTETERSHHLNIKPVLERLVSHIRQHAFAGSREGEETATDIYLHVIQQITRIPRHQARPSDIPALLKRLSDLRVRAEEFAQFSLSSAFPSDKFASEIEQTPPDLRFAVQDILDPYLRGIEARLDALSGIKGLIGDYVNTINSFLHNKSVSFSVRRGLTFNSKLGEVLDPDVLSSGEKQLIMLMSNTVLAIDNPGIFLIDEPEMSLNVKWQRELVSALLNIAVESNIQYIMATHSLELITQHRTNAIRLISDFPPHD